MYIDINIIIILGLLIKSYIVVVGITVLICKRKKIHKIFKELKKEYK